MFNFGRPKNSQSDLTSLNLDIPAASSDARQEPVTKQQVPPRVIDPQVQAEINRRSLELAKSGKHPEAIFHLVHPVTRNPIILALAQPTSKPVLLFSSAATARFFMQERNLQAEMTGVAFDQVTRMAENLRALGVDSFVMDPSPKYASANVHSPTDKLITRGQVTFAWALSRTIRNFNAHRVLRPILGSQNFGSPEIQKRLRQALEVMRALGGYEVPFLHWMIALIAGIQHDELGRLEATSDLEAFGPDFVGRTLPIESYEDPEGWMKSWAQAQQGLMIEFEMLSGPDGKPLESVLRTVNVLHRSSPDRPDD